MAQILRKWIADHAINNDKIDWTDTYTITGLRVDETNAIGRVGIGISNPLDALHIRRTDTSAGMILDLDDGGDGQAYQLYSDQSGVFNIKDLDSGEVRFNITSPNASLGRIGINTTLPLDTIHARSILEGAALRLDTDDGFNGRAYRLLSDTDGKFKIIDADATATWLEIAPNGTLTYYGDATFEQNLQVDGTTALVHVVMKQLEINQTDNDPALIVSQDTTGTTATVMLIENVGDGYALTIDKGYVGIGTLAPEAMFHVQGDIITADGSNIGDTTHRIGTLWMDSTIDYLSNLNFSSGGVHVTFATDGKVGIGSEIPAHALDVVGDIVGNADITAANNITAVTGDITASAGNIGANQSVTAGTFITAIGNITSTTGNVQATIGNLLAPAGSVRALDMTATVGNIVAAGQLQGATLNITTGPSDITGVTSVIGDFTVKNSTDVKCIVSRTGDGSAIFGISNAAGSFGWGNYTTTGDSLIQSSTGESFHIGSIDQVLPTMTFLSTGNAQVNGNDLGSATVQDKLVIGSAVLGDSIGIARDGYGIHFLHRTTDPYTFQSRISSEISSVGSGSDIVLSTSLPNGNETADQVVRISRTDATSEQISLIHENDSTAFRIKTYRHTGTTHLSITEMGAVDGGQTHLTCYNGYRAVSILGDITKLGWVGIHTQNPTEMLHVVGNGLFTGGLAANSLTVPTLNVQGPGDVEIKIIKTGVFPFDGTTIYAVTNDVGTYGWDSVITKGESIIQTSTGKRLHLGTVDLSVPTMSLDDAGYVGIGTTIPADKFHVQGNIITADGSNIGNAGHRIGTIFMDSTVDYGNDLFFNSGGTNYVRIKTNGKVGIGIDPQDLLHLYGGASNDLDVTLRANRVCSLNLSSDGVGSGNTNINFDNTDNASNTYFNFKNSGVTSGEIQYNHQYNYLALKYEDAFYIQRRPTVQNYFTMGSTGRLTYTGHAEFTNKMDVSGFTSLNDSMLAVGDGTATYAGHFTSKTAPQTIFADSSNSTGSAIICKQINTSSTTGSSAITANNWGGGYGVRATAGAGTAIYGTASGVSGRAGRLLCNGASFDATAVFIEISQATATAGSIGLSVENAGQGDGIHSTALNGYAGRFRGAMRFDAIVSSSSAVDQYIGVGYQGDVSVHELQSVSFAVNKNTVGGGVNLTSGDIPALGTLITNSTYYTHSVSSFDSVVERWYNSLAFNFTTRYNDSSAWLEVIMNSADYRKVNQLIRGTIWYSSTGSLPT